MRLLLSLSFFILVALPGLCQIQITTDEIWQDDTVTVEQNIIVAEGASLTIYPGTVVLFVDQNFIDVYGTLNINGTEGDSVIMTAVDSTWIEVNSLKQFYGWGGIYAYNTGKVKATHTVFEKLGYSHHSKDGYAVFGVLRNESSEAMAFEHCRFALKRDPKQIFDGSSIEGKNATLIIKNSVFKNNRGRGPLIYSSNHSSILISETTFANNDMEGILVYAPAVFINMEKCRFENNKTRALLYVITYNGSSAVEQNIFKNNLGAIQMQGVFSDIYFRNNLYEKNGGQVYFWLGNNVITGNVFLDNFYADPYDFFGNDYEGIVRIENTEVTGPVIINNSFINNRATALRMWSTNTFTIENNIFHNNYPLDTSLSLDSEYLNTSGRTFQYNLMDELVSGTGNMEGNPRLSNEPEGFLLSANSPAIDNGTAAHSDYLLPSDLMGHPRIKGQIDIGAVEFLHSYIPLTEISISDTVVFNATVGAEVANLKTVSEFGLDAITFTLPDENGMNNDYFSIEDDNLILKKELTSEKLLRIKVRAEHISGAWVEGYYYLTITETIVGVEQPVNTARRVFPIPTDKFLHVDEHVPGMTYSIFSVSGVILKSGIWVEDVMDVSELADGIYILQLSDGNKVDRIKFYKSAR